MQTADVVIIGGGPAGAAAAWALHRADPSLSMVILEKNQTLAAGTSMASLENFRTCWAAACLMKMMLRSVEIFHHPEAYFEGDTHLGVRQQGYLFCGMSEADERRLRSEVAHLHSVGLRHVEFLDADEVRYRFPWAGDRVIAAKYDPVAGWLDSNGLIHALARTSGADIVFNASAVQIQVTGGAVSGVTHSQGSIAARKVIIAAGPDSRAVGQTAGVDLPLIVRPRQSFTTPWRHPEFPPDAPTLIGAPPFPHVRPEARDGAIFGWEYHWNTRRLDGAGSSRDELVEPRYPVSQWKDPRFPSMALLLLARQFGHRDDEGFASGNYLRRIDHRAGYYTFRDSTNAYVTRPDGSRQPYESQRAILDAVPGVDGLFASVAHVGHGIMSAPAAGEIIAARVLGLPLPDPDFAAFGYEVPFVEHDSGGLTPNAD
ncbi:FAD-binding oxidoreductase [Kamptonema cortianum]|nr:FAD-binding oxidoreductase [Kamptonema cortianum]